MEIIADIIMSLAIFPDEAVRTLRDRESSAWARVLAGLALLCYAIFMIALVALMAWILS